MWYTERDIKKHNVKFICENKPLLSILIFKYSCNSLSLSLPIQSFRATSVDSSAINLKSISIVHNVRNNARITMQECTRHCYTAQQLYIIAYAITLCNTGRLGNTIISAYTD